MHTNVVILYLQSCKTKINSSVSYILYYYEREHANLLLDFVYLEPHTFYWLRTIFATFCLNCIVLIMTCL